MDKRIARVVAYLRAHHTMDKPATLEDVMRVYGTDTTDARDIVDTVLAVHASPYVTLFWTQGERRYAPGAYVAYDSAQRERDESDVAAAIKDVLQGPPYVCNSGCGRTVDMAAQQCSACRERDVLVGHAVNALRRMGIPKGAVLYDVVGLEEIRNEMTYLLERARERLPDPVALAAVRALGALWAVAPWHASGSAP